MKEFNFTSNIFSMCCMRYVSFKLIKNEYKNAENMIYFDTVVNIFQVIIYLFYVIFWYSGFSLVHCYSPT